VTSGEPIQATKTRSTFRLRCSVSAIIRATPERIWSLLTTPEDMCRWNSTLTSIEGSIAFGGTMKMRVPEAPGRTFVIKVARFVPPTEMVWANGHRLFFLGERTYRPGPTGTPGETRFQMAEEFSGPLLPLIAGHLPDFGPIFERYAADLRVEAER